MKQVLLIALAILLLTGIVLLAFDSPNVSDDAAARESIVTSPQPDQPQGQPGSSESTITPRTGGADTPHHLRDAGEALAKRPSDSTSTAGETAREGTALPQEANPTVVGEINPKRNEVSGDRPVMQSGQAGSPVNQSSTGAATPHEDPLGPDIPAYDGPSPESDGLPSIEVPPEGFDPVISVTPPEDSVQGDPGAPPEG